MKDIMEVLTSVPFLNQIPRGLGMTNGRMMSIPHDSSGVCQTHLWSCHTDAGGIYFLHVIIP